MNDIVELWWQGCYDSGWQGLLTPESFAHPAKAAHGLLTRIYDHLFATGRLAKGSVVVDPFGGVGTTGLIGASRGCKVLSLELEPRFVALAQGNYELHRHTWETFGDPLPVIVQGDSRRLVATLGPLLADAVVGSPPYEGTPLQSGGDNIKAGRRRLKESGEWSKDLTDGENKGYGTTPGQLGQEQGDTFWAAGMVIVEQCYEILRPGGHAVWITKDFVRNKARVPFSADWARLCQACGFRLVEWVRASLVKRTEEASLFGGVEVTEVSRKSFFRRLAERKGSPRIDEEDVLVLVKDGPGGQADAVIGSPPYAESLHKGEPTTPEKIERNNSRDIMAGKGIASNYGYTAGQLGAMPPGSLDAALGGNDDANN